MLPGNNSKKKLNKWEFYRKIRREMAPEEEVHTDKKRYNRTMKYKPTVMDYVTGSIDEQ
jgi:hypothetical protein